MEFEVFGIRADLDVRTKVPWNETELMDLYEKIGQPCVILTTCHRFEIYSEIPVETAPILKRYEKEPIEIYTKSGKEAILHLLEVVNGLHSQIFGEDEILRQVKQAYEFSVHMHRCSSALHFIFQQAVKCGKEARTKYRMSQHPLSLAYIAVRSMGDVSGKKILLTGNGEIAARILNYLKDKPCEIMITARNKEHAASMLETVRHAVFVPFRQRYEAASQCDILCSATSAPHYVYRYFPCSKPLQLYDFASPRDIDPAFEHDPDASVYTLDTLAAIAKENENIRHQELGHVRKLIDQYAETIRACKQDAARNHTLLSLQQAVELVSRETYEYLEHKLDLNEREKSILKKSLNASMFRLMRTPIQEISRHYDQLEPETLNRLFRQP